ncbi:glycosyltransferase family 92 protein F13G3.3-like [Pelodytes ibericus]
MMPVLRSPLKLKKRSRFEVIPIYWEAENWIDSLMARKNHLWKFCSRICLALFLLTLVIISYAFHLRQRAKEIQITEIYPESSGTITPLDNNRTFIISAYYDDRESRSVRVIAILHIAEVKELYCWFHCRNNNGYVTVQAQIDIHGKRFGFSYGTTDLLCKEPQDCCPQRVSIHWSAMGNVSQIPSFEIKNRNPPPISVDFTVCISTFFGKGENVLQFIQAVEMYRLLGAQKVVIYKNSCSKPIAQVVDYYVSEGVMEVVPWPVDKYLRTSDAWHHSMDPQNQIGYYGQVTALNDCLYRNMYTSKYVTFNDLDEIILPKIHKDWTEMMGHLEKQYPSAVVFLVENHYFPIGVTDQTFGRVFPKELPGRNILQYIYYEPEQENVYNNHKMIVNPRKVIQTSVHNVLKSYGPVVEVPDLWAGLHHTREAKQPHLNFTSLIKDTTLWKYNSSLISNVNRVLEKLHYKV